MKLPKPHGPVFNSAKSQTSMSWMGETHTDQFSILRILSGKTQIMEHHHFEWETHHKWPCSIAMLNYQGVSCEQNCHILVLNQLEKEMRPFPDSDRFVFVTISLEHFLASMCHHFQGYFTIHPPKKMWMVEKSGTS